MASRTPSLFVLPSTKGMRESRTTFRDEPVKRAGCPGDRCYRLVSVMGTSLSVNDLIVF